MNGLIKMCDIHSELNKSTDQLLNEKDLDFKINIATETLNRNISFITSCDNKTSIVLTAAGVIFTLLMTNNTFADVINIIKLYTSHKDCFIILYCLGLGVALLFLLIGLIYLGSVLIAKTSSKIIADKRNPSNIFFCDIDSNENVIEYENKFYNMNKADLLKDLITQIYINANIATIKYKNYNKGVNNIMGGFIILFIMLCISHYIL